MKNNIVSNELYKLFSRKIFVIFLAFAVVINIFLSINAGNQFTAQFFATPQGYKEYYNSLPQSDSEAVSVVQSDINKSKQEISIASFMYERVLLEIETRLNYDEYLDFVDEQAVSIAKSGLFFNTESFNAKNVEKTAADFETMRGVAPQFAPSAGVELATSSAYTDVLAIAVLFVAILILLLYERENGLLSLTRTTPRGTYFHAVTKVYAVMLLCILCIVVFYLPKFLINEFIFGLGDLSRPLQSVYGYAFGVFRTSVGGFLASYCGLKLFSLAALAVFLCFIAVLCRRAIYAYAAMTAACVPAVLFISTEKFLGKYENYNIFSVPVLSIYVLIFALTIAFVTFFALTVIIYARQSSADKTLVLHGFSGGGLFTTETYKLLFQNKTALILLCFAALSAYIAVFLPVRKAYPGGLDDMYYKRIAVQREGEMTQENVELIRADAAAAENISGSLITEIEDRIAYLSARPGSIFYYEKGINKLTFGDISEDLWLFLICAVAVSACCMNLFALERKTGAIFLITATKNGIAKTRRAKIIIAGIMIIIITSAVYIPYIVQIFLAYGTYGLSAPAMSLPHLSFMPGWIDGLQAVIFAFVLRLITLCGVGAVAANIGRGNSVK